VDQARAHGGEFLGLVAGDQLRVGVDTQGDAPCGALVDQIGPFLRGLAPGEGVGKHGGDGVFTRLRGGAQGGQRSAGGERGGESLEFHQGVLVWILALSLWHRQSGTDPAASGWLAWRAWSARERDTAGVSTAGQALWAFGRCWRVTRSRSTIPEARRECHCLMTVDIARADRRTLRLQQPA